MKPIPAEYAGLYQASEYLSENELGWSYSRPLCMWSPPSKRAGGYVTPEATSCGLPVIVSANVDSADMVE